MPEITRGTKAAVVAGVAVLASGGVTTPASAHTYGGAYSGSHLQVGTLDMRGTLNPDVYHAILDRKLDAVAAYAATLQAKVAAIPATTVLTGEARSTAKFRLAKVVAMRHLLAMIPPTGPYAATAAERADIDAIDARLAATKSMLLARLDNLPVTPTATKVLDVRATTKVLNTRFDRDAWWRWWSMFGDRDHRWDGSRYDGHHCDHH
jgi:hypothetical protein